MRHKPATQSPVLVESVTTTFVAEVNIPQDNDSESEKASKYCGSSDVSGSIKILHLPPRSNCTPVAERRNVRKKKKSVDNFEKMEEFVDKIMKF